MTNLKVVGGEGKYNARDGQPLVDRRGMNRKERG